MQPIFTISRFKRSLVPAFVLSGGELLAHPSQAATLTVSTTADSGAGSLRQAILDANANPDFDTIRFQIGSGAQVIKPSALLPEITSPVIIDGTTQPGTTVNTGPLVEIDGTNTPRASGRYGLVLRGGNSTIKGLAITNFYWSNSAAIRILGPGNNTVSGCYISLHIGGLTFGDNADGVSIEDSPNNTVGGLSSAARNLFAACGGFPVNIMGTKANSNQVIGNWIGLKKDGTTFNLDSDGNPIYAGSSGVYILHGSNNVIGGPSQESRNVIVDAANYGVEITYAANNRVLGNYIGINSAGTAALGRQKTGISVLNSPGTIIGGTSLTEGNVISGNSSDGIIITGVQSTGVQISANLIGTDWGGNKAVPNKGNGIHIGNSASNVTVGGYGAGPRNLISGNNGAGVMIDGSAKTVLVQGNRIGTNFLGTAAIANNEGVHLDGNVTGVLIGSANPDARNLISGNSSHGIAMNGTGVTKNTVQGNWIGTDVDGTKALPNGGRGVWVNGPANLIGGPTDSAGTGAGNIISGNTLGGIHLAVNSGNCDVQGNLIGLQTGGYAALPNKGDGVFLDGSNRNNRIGGTEASTGNIISGNTNYGVHLTGYANYVHFLYNNRIGTNAAGTSAVGNSLGGILVDDYSSSHRIGAVNAGNLISGNGGPGISFLGQTQLNIVAGNKIGTDITGTKRISNNTFGILIRGTGFQLIGSSVAGGGNLISGNKSEGVRIEGDPPRDPNNSLIYFSNVLVNNIIGLDVTGTQSLGNFGAGVGIIGGATYNQIGAGFDSSGKQAAFRANRIAFNAGGGVVIGGDSTFGHEVSGNSIWANGNVGIDLGKNDASGYRNTPNDAGDSDEGPNHLQNTPIIVRAVLRGTEITLKGTLDSKPSTKYWLDFYSSYGRLDSKTANAETFLGRKSVTTNTSGQATFEVKFTGVDEGGYYTASATDDKYNTSEFCAPVVASLPDTTLPTVAMTKPTANGSYLFEDMNLATGTASDNAGGSGLAQVYLNLYRYAATGRTAGYWNGQSWVAQLGAGTNLSAQLDGKQWELTLPSAAQGFGGGKFALRAFALDNDGNLASTDSRTFTVTAPDTVAPTVGITAPVANSSVYSVEKATGTAQDNVGGSGLTGVQIQLFRKAATGIIAGYWNPQFGTWQATPADNAATISGNNWAWNLPTSAQGFIPATYTLRATATDRGGNSATQQVGFTLLKDTVAPTVQITSPLVNASLPSLTVATGTASDAASGLASVQIWLARLPYGNTTAGFWNAQTKQWQTTSVENPATLSGGNWNFAIPTVAQGFVPGRYTITAFAYDLAGNRNTIASLFTVGNPDLLPPTIALQTPITNTTYKSLATISGLASDEIGGSGLQEVRVVINRPAQFNLPEAFWNGTAWTSPYNEAQHKLLATSNGLNWSIKVPTKEFASGRFITYAEARDKSGNRGLSSTISFTLDPNAVLDTGLPTVGIDAPLANGFYKGSFDATGIVADAAGGQGIARVQVQFYRYGGQGIAAGYWDGVGDKWSSQPVASGFLAASVSGNTWRRSLPFPTAIAGAGHYAIIATAQDKAGNSVKTAVTPFIFDNIPPQIAVTAPVPGLQTIAKALGTVSDPLATDGSSSGLAKVTVVISRIAQGSRPFGYWQGGNNWSITLNDNCYVPATVSGKTWSFTLPTTLQGGGAGAYQIRAVATDKAGNQISNSAFTFTVSATGAITSSAAAS